jgi:hypothetical protein
VAEGQRLQRTAGQPLSMIEDGAADGRRCRLG